MNSETYIDVDTSTSLGLYKITRHCGGPEEGGWYYNWYEHCFSIPLITTSQEEIDMITRLLKARFPDHGNIYSVNGGYKYLILGEKSEGEHQTKQVPYYE
jgi:hypothetical protein